MISSLRNALAVAAIVYSAALGQKPEFEFFTEFRNVFTPKLRAESPSITNEEILQKYASGLLAQGIPESEIKRRVDLIQTQRQALEIDMWNRVYSSPNPEFNQAPNAFLMQMVGRRTPGVALDYAMGEGRNAIYLAQLGWDVWGFDQAGAAIALAQKKAKELNLNLKTSAVS